MPIIGAGLSHRTAPVEIRERLSIAEQELPEALSVLLAQPSISEAVILSTCNRTEIYAVSTGVEEGQRDVVTFLVQYHRVPEESFKDCLYFYSEEKIVHHLFRVASSLDSMVIGEAQILGQVKNAYMIAFENQATDIVLNRFFRQAIECGKRVRTETAIGEAPVSISYAAVQLARNVFETLEKRPVMVVGAGKMSELTIKHLVAHGASPIMVTNRTFARARELAENFCGVPVPFEDRFVKMIQADIVVSSTGSPHFVITKEEIQAVMKARRNRSLFLIDIAVPRDIDPEVGKLENVYLYDIDDLKDVVDESLSERRREAEKAEAIVLEEVEEFLGWLGARDVVPTIRALRDRAEAVKAIEMEKAMRRLSHLSERDREAVKALASGIVNKMLHHPTVRLKEKANDKDSYLYVDAIRYLFGLDEERKDGE